jgi:hypothetical protein
MVSRQIQIDEETDRLLSDLAKDYEGDLGLALTELVHARDGLQSFAEQSESAEAASLTAQLERAERGFREGRFTRWEDVKRQNGL